MARRLRGLTPGFTILELLFVLAIAGTLTTIAVPQSLRALDDFRARSAARYLAQRLGDARLGAIRQSLAHGLRFEAGTPDYRITSVTDGNANGLRTAEIQTGVDRTVTPGEMLTAHFQDVAFGILDGVPDAELDSGIQHRVPGSGTAVVRQDVGGRNAARQQPAAHHRDLR